MQRGQLDNTPDVVSFAQSLEQAVIDTVEVDGIMTKDLALACGKQEREAWVTTSVFLDSVEKRFKDGLKAKSLL
jgi:isocitrate dehydrogenase